MAPLPRWQGRDGSPQAALVVPRPGLHGVERGVCGLVLAEHPGHASLYLVVAGVGLAASDIGDYAAVAVDGDGLHSAGLPRHSTRRLRPLTRPHSCLSSGASMWAMRMLWLVSGPVRTRRVSPSCTEITSASN